MRVYTYKITGINISDAACALENFIAGNNIPINLTSAISGENYTYELLYALATASIVRSGHAHIIDRFAAGEHLTRAFIDAVAGNTTAESDTCLIAQPSSVIILTN